MKKTSSIVKLSILGVILIIGIILSFCSFHLGMTNYKSFASAIKLGIDLKGGIYAVYDIANPDDTANLDERLEGTRVRLQNLIVSKGYSEATVVREGKTRLRVEVPDVDDPQSIFNIIGKPAELKFVLVDTNEIVITGDHVLKASAISNYQGSPGVELSLNSEGTKKFGDATTNNSGKTMNIVLSVDGEEDKIVSSATINEAITGGKAIISGLDSYESAKNTADQIMSGTFEVKLSLKESATVSATLGDEALKWGLIAGAIGLLVVMIFLIVFYRGLGVIASIALMLYTVLMLFFLAVLPWVQLTLPGIAGIILSLGMAVDANIVIYERIKDEYKGGKSILASSHAGFKKATIAIIDSNVTTIIAAVMLLIFGTGSIKGFALTLLIGIILSLFTSLLVTRFLVNNSMRINSSNAKFYNLKRGKGYEQVDSNSSADGDRGVTNNTINKVEKVEGVIINENN